MKYAHLADLHLGSWREEKMRDISTQTFLKAIDMCVDEQVDFILFAGDIFNTSLPAMDTLKIVTKKLKELQDRGIPLYVIAGSHDFSPSGKTMIDVLENAGLLKNVCKGTVNEKKQLVLDFTTDEKTGAKITGILGRKGQLDRSYYENLALEHLEKEEGHKIFMFHTSLTELKPKHLEKMESYPASFLPKGFNYYAGGHIHHKARVDLPEYGPLTYPGALFPNNFAEVEKYSHGGFYIIDTEIRWFPVIVKPHVHILIDCSHKTPQQVQDELLHTTQNLQDAIVTIRFTGTIENGTISDVNFSEVFETLYGKGAFFVMKNTSQVQTQEFEEIKVSFTSMEEVEEQLMKEHLQQTGTFDADSELEMTKLLLQSLNIRKAEGETVTDFTNKVLAEMERTLHLYTKKHS